MLFDDSTMKILCMVYILLLNVLLIQSQTAGPTPVPNQQPLPPGGGNQQQGRPNQQGPGPQGGGNQPPLGGPNQQLGGPNQQFGGGRPNQFGGPNQFGRPNQPGGRFRPPARQPGTYCYVCRSDLNPDCAEDYFRYETKCTAEIVEQYQKDLKTMPIQLGRNVRQNSGGGTDFKCGIQTNTAGTGEFIARFCIFDLEHQGANRECHHCTIKDPEDAECCYCLGSFCNGDNGRSVDDGSSSSLIATRSSIFIILLSILIQFIN